MRSIDLIRTPALSCVEPLGSGYYKLKPGLSSVRMEYQVVKSGLPRILPGARMGEARVSLLRTSGVDVTVRSDPWLVDNEGKAR